jgi:hypothetical protein
MIAKTLVGVIIVLLILVSLYLWLDRDGDNLVVRSRQPWDW